MVLAVNAGNLSGAPDMTTAAEVCREFEHRRGRPPAVLVRAPGRVNLIGEHVDYCGLPVLPVAIDRAVWAAAAPAVRPCVDTMLRGAGSEWERYAEAGVRAAREWLRPAGEPTSAAGADVLFHSDLPVAAGLSSSSALAVAATLVALEIGGGSVPALDDAVARLRLASVVAEAERGSAGTRGGAMDQTASLMGVAGHALHIRFVPHASVQPVPLPENWRLVVAWSGKSARKGGSARRVFNERVAQADEIARHFGAGPAANALGSVLPVSGAKLPGVLKKRFAHINGEARRTHEAVAALRARDPGRFGELLNQSHASLRDLYEVSTPRLDELVNRALGAGASGARLTGAGMGGCIVAVCEAGAVQRVMQSLEDAEPFVARPAAGAEARSLAREG